MKLGGGGQYTIHAKWKGVGGQALVHGGRGWGGRRGFAPLENEKRKGEYRPVSAVEDKWKKYICAMRDQNEYPADI